MTIQQKATRGGLWFAVISVLTQAISWVFTFYVIRLLDPQDYGLMTMASFLTGYLQIFSGLGLGSAIVQRETILDDEVSSVFWFSLAFGVVMSVVVLALAHPTALLFNEPRVIPITQLIGVLFVISALTTVPHNLLMREFELKKLALVNMLAVLVSSCASVALALAGYGVYALIWTNIILNSLRMILLFRATGWRPRLHYSHQEVKPYLHYGLYMAMSGAAMRLFQSLDKLIIGKMFGATQLGLYGNAMTIASMPIDKISPLYQQVSFPLFARLQTDVAQCRRSYVDLARHYLLLMSPIYLGSIIVAPDLILLGLGEKWLPMTTLFQAICVAKLVEVLTSYHSVLLSATGQHRSVFRFNVLLCVVVPLAILVAARHSFEAVIWPWLIAYPLVSLGWLFASFRTAQLPVAHYMRALWDGMQASFVMAGALLLVKMLPAYGALAGAPARLAVLVGAGAIVFAAFLLLFQRDLIVQAVRTLGLRSASTQVANS